MQVTTNYGKFHNHTYIRIDRVDLNILILVRLPFFTIPGRMDISIYRIDGLGQDCSNSIGTRWSYCNLALSHRNAAFLSSAIVIALKVEIGPFLLPFYSMIQRFFHWCRHVNAIAAISSAACPFFIRIIKRWVLRNVIHMFHWKMKLPYQSVRCRQIGGTKVYSHNDCRWQNRLTE